MRSITVLLLVVLGVAPARAQTDWTDLPVPSAALKLLDVPIDAGRPLAVLRAVRVRQSIVREAEELPAPLAELELLLRDLERLEAQTVRMGTRGASLSMARTNTERDGLRDWCEVIGLRLRERRNVYSVEADRDKDAQELRRRLALTGIDVDGAAKRLNAGESVTLAPAVVDLPSPLPLDVWARAIFQRDIPPRSVFGAVIRDREAALLFHGLAAMSAETRAFLAEQPQLLRHFYTDAAGAVAAFGGAFRVERGAAVLPGGDEARELWEAMLDERLTEPEKVARRLFGRDSGRFAYFTYTLAHLDPPHRAFALGLWIKDRGIRLDRLRALYRVFADVDPEWTIARHPFGRPLYDPGTLLTAVYVRPGGEPAGPSFRKFWDRGLDGNDIPSRDARIDGVDEDGFLDAAWLAERLGGGLAGERRALMDRVLFGQRAFGDTSPAELPDVLVAVRGFGRFPALVLLLERAGVRQPAAYAAAVRAAATIDAIESPSQAVPLLTQFQGALAVIDRAARGGALGPDRVDDLVTSLAALPVTGDGYRGGLLRWIDERLMPHFPAPGSRTSIDARLLRALSDGGEPAAPFEWEGTSYVPDLEGASLKALEAVRAKQGGNTLDAIRAVAREVTALAQPNLSVQDIQARAAALRAAGNALVPARPWPDLPDDLPQVKKILDRALRDLANIKRPRDAGKAARVVEPLTELLDFLLGETLTALAYAPSMGDADELLGPAADLSHRHDFGLIPKPGATVVAKQSAWRRPKFSTATGAGQGLLGSVFGIDLTLARKQLRRLATDRLPAPRLNGNDAAVFTETLSQTNPHALTTATLQVIGRALARGRERVQQAADASALDSLAAAVSMSEARRTALSWARAKGAGVDELFSMTEIFWLGIEPAAAQTVAPWGTTHEPLEGCYCTRFPNPGAWDGLSGRLGSLQMGTAVADLNLRVAEHLAALEVPASLFRPVLAFATQDFIDGAPALYDDDWAGVVLFAGRLSRERVEDYVAAIVAAGPVREQSAAEAAGGQP